MGRSGGRRWKADGEARQGAPKAAGAGRSGWEGRQARRRERGPRRWRPAGPRATAPGQRGVRGHLGAGRGAGKGAREAAGPGEPPRVERRRARGWTGHSSQGKDRVPQRTWVSGAKHAHARRKVLVGRPALLLPGSSPARHRDPGRCGKEPCSPRGRPRSWSPSRSGARLAELGTPQLCHLVLREGTVVGRYLERPSLCFHLQESFKAIFKEKATFKGF